MHVLDACRKNVCDSCVGAVRGGHVSDPLYVRVRFTKKKERGVSDGCQTAGRGRGAAVCECVQCLLRERHVVCDQKAGIFVSAFPAPNIVPGI